MSTTTIEEHRRRLASGLALLALLLAPARGLGAGFAISEWGAHALGMGNAVAAVANTPSAVAFNPAGLVQLEGLTFEAGVTMISPSFSYTLPAPGTSTRVDVDGERAWFPVPAVYAAYRVHDRVAVGLGLYSMYGLGVSWSDSVQVPGEPTPRAWWGRGLVEELSLQTAHITPTVALRLHDRVLLGGGLAFVKGAVGLERAVTLSDSLDDDVGVKFSGGDWGVTATGGLLIEAVPRLLKLGVAYRGGVTLTFAGDAVFEGVPAGLRDLLRDSRAEAEIALPHVLTVAVAAFPLEGLTVGLAVDFTTWSSYEELAIRFFDEDGSDNADLSTTEAKDWRNTMAVRLGAEYFVTPRLPLRLGLVYDQSPVPDTTVGPDLPDADRYEIAVGAGYRVGDLSVDLAYLFLMSGEHETAATAPLVGSYRGRAHLLALTLGYKLAL